MRNFFFFTFAIGGKIISARGGGGTLFNGTNMCDTTFGLSTNPPTSTRLGDSCFDVQTKRRVHGGSRLCVYSMIGLTSRLFLVEFTRTELGLGRRK